MTFFTILQCIRDVIAVKVFFSLNWRINYMDKMKEGVELIT